MEDLRRLREAELKVFKDILMLIWKDVLVEIRRMYEIVAIVSFPSAGVIAFTYLYQETSGMGPLAFTFIITILSTLFITTTSFQREYDKKTLYGLLTLPTSTAIVFLSKMLYTFLMVMITGFTTLFMTSVMIGLPQLSLNDLIMTLLIYKLNLASISSLVSAITMYSEGKILLIPLIIMVYSFPIIFLAASAITNLFFQFPVFWEIQVMFLHFIAFTAFSLALSEFIL